MSVTILPYIDDKTTNAIQTAVKAASVPASDDTGCSFQELLENADRAQQAMAVDTLISASQSGQISAETVQKLLGFNPQPCTAVSSSSTTGKASAGTAASNGSTGSSSSTSSSSSSDILGCPDNLEDYFEEAAKTYNVDVNLLKAIAKAESGFNPSATSSAGAMGIMQLMPSTASGLDIKDAYRAYDNIMGGAKIISQNLEKYDGDLSLALAAYNAGSGNVDKYGGIPPFEETQNYVKKVLNYYQKYS